MSCSIAAIESRRAADRHVLSDHERRFLLTRRVGHLATADSRAIPHVVPVCFTISQSTLYITVDEKPKRVAGPALKRVRNIERNPMVAIVVDRYDEDWTRLGWVMLRGRAEILRAGTEHDRAQELLRSRYRQLAAMQIAERPVIAVRLERVTSWGNLAVGEDAAKTGGQGGLSPKADAVNLPTNQRREPSVTAHRAKLKSDSVPFKGLVQRKLAVNANRLRPRAWKPMCVRVSE